MGRFCLVKVGLLNFSIIGAPLRGARILVEKSWIYENLRH